MAEPIEDAFLIYKVVAGSRAYGLDSPGSDLDLRGVYIPPRRYLLGLSPFEQWEQREAQGDTIIYALVKFVRLALACNPNIIELLYVEPRHILFINDYGQRLLQHRDHFLSKQVRHTFAGYALRPRCGAGLSSRP
jgi:predicted nucleotidyltransferase